MSVSFKLSDHFPINTEMSLQWPFSPATSVSYRSFTLIDINAFLLDLKETQLLLDPPNDLDQLVDLHNNTLRGLKNKHVPLRVRQMPQRSLIA